MWKIFGVAGMNSKNNSAVFRSKLLIIHAQSDFALWKFKSHKKKKKKSLSSFKNNFQKREKIIQLLLRIRFIFQDICISTEHLCNLNQLVSIAVTGSIASH